MDFRRPFLSLLGAIVAFIAGCTAAPASEPVVKAGAQTLSVVIPVRSCAELLSQDMVGIGGSGSRVGHQGGGGEFGRDPQQRTDFAHRAVHLTAVAAKQLIRFFYGRSESYAYFTGCSDGKAIVSAARLPLLHQAVLKQCDALDGQVDGLISDPRTCTFDRLRARHPLFDATDPALSPFAARGGKLILWHGLADPHISPINTIAYHDAVGAQLGAGRRDAFERLYLLPGVHHCSGGEGPSAIDLLTPMLEWVERGTAPQGIFAIPTAERQASSSFGQPTGARDAATAPVAGPARAPRAQPPSALVARTVFPYPAISVDGARRAPAAVPEVPRWAGTDFFR